MGGPVGSILGTAGSIALGTNPFAAIGSTLATNAMLGGGSNSSSPNVGGETTPVYAQPDFNYGANTYTLNNKPYDASKYFITGDKGVYNLLPMLNNAYTDPNRQDLTTGSYNTYQSIYDKMAGDAAAQAAFAKAYGPQTFTYTPPIGTSTKGGPGGINQSISSLNLPRDVSRDLSSTFKNQINAAKKYYNNSKLPTTTTPYNYTPIQYSNFGLDSNANLFADYAAKQNNPFFVPFAPKPATVATTPTAPVNPVGSLANPSQYQPVNVRQGGIIGLLRN